MNKRNEEITIRGIENGYLVEYIWYPLDAERMTLYRYNKYSFRTWDEVTEWVKNNALSSPPTHE